jgi:hypothetical protein
VRRDDRDRESGTWRMSASATPGQLSVPRIAESSITSLRGFRFTKGGREDYDGFTSPSSSQRSMCFGRGLSSASTVLAIRQVFACRREETRSSRFRNGPGGGGSRRGLRYLNRHDFELPPKPGDLRAGLPPRPVRPVTLHARASCQGQRAGGSANRRAITAVLRATRGTLSEWRRLLSCP